MAGAKEGDTVKVHYKGTLQDGTVFDDSHDREPLEFTIGAGEIIPGFEDAVIGMEPGEEATAEVDAEDAYGERHDELVASVSRDELPDDLDLQVGQRLEMQDKNGESMILAVSDVDDSTVTLDANHPLAGEDLVFGIELLEIVDAS
jgi:FKBP-type peptidyl-prolyl cis-trans isomerase 2